METTKLLPLPQHTVFMTLILNIKRNFFSTGRKSTRNSRCGKMMILPTIYEDPPTDLRFTTMTDNLARAEAYIRKTKRKIDQATMNKCLRTSIRLNTNDARLSTKIPVQNLQQSSPPKRSSFLSDRVRKEDAQTKKRLVEFKLSSPLTTIRSRTQEDYTIALQTAFQNFKRRTKRQNLKPPSTVAQSQDTPALYLGVPEHQETADVTHNNDNQTTAKTAADTNNREAPASSDTPEQKTLSTTTARSKELDCLHCARERADHHQTIPSNQAIAKETSTAVDALSREFRNSQNQKQLAISRIPETCPFRNPMKLIGLPPINMIVQRICTRTPSKPSSPLLPSSPPLLSKVMTPDAMIHAINFQSISMMTPPSTPHSPLFPISSHLLPQAMRPAAMKQDPSNACAITIAGAKNEFSTVKERALARKYGTNALLHQSSICSYYPPLLTADRPTFYATTVAYEPTPLPLPPKPGGAQSYDTLCFHPIIRCLS